MVTSKDNSASEAANYVDVSDLTIEVCSRERAYPIFRQHSQRMKATRIRKQRGLHKLLNEIKCAIWTATPVHLRRNLDLDEVGLCPERQATLNSLPDDKREEIMALVAQELLVELLLRSREERECYCCTMYRMVQELERVMKDFLINHTEEGEPTAVKTAA